MYVETESKELLELINNHDKLTFQSQIDLKDELISRGFSNESNAISETIKLEIEEINKFRYLNELGFEIDEDEHSLRVVRTTKAIITDVFAVILGLILTLMGLFGIVTFIDFISSGIEIGFTTIISAVINVAFVLLGVKFLSGVKRVFDFWGFELSKSGETIKLRKRFDLKLEEIQSDTQAISLAKKGGRMIVRMKEHDLLNCNATDLIHTMTLESLFRKLRG